MIPPLGPRLYLHPSECIPLLMHSDGVNEESDTLLHYFLVINCITNVYVWFEGKMSDSGVEIEDVRGL